jgi:hypothetical protein
MRLAILSVALASVFVATEARAAIFCWQDPQGVTHYVDDLAKVPADYQQQIVTFVTDLPTRSPALPEESSLRPAPPAEPIAAPAARPEPQRIDTSFEDGYWAGMAAAHVSAPTDPGPATIGPIVQNVQVFEATPLIPSFLVVGPSFVPRVLPRPRRAFAPTRGDRFIQGPGGPPPIGAAGPPPISFGFGHR